MQASSNLPSMLIKKWVQQLDLCHLCYNVLFHIFQKITLEIGAKQASKLILFWYGLWNSKSMIMNNYLNLFPLYQLLIMSSNASASSSLALFPLWLSYHIQIFTNFSST